MAKNKITIAVLMGGNSSEREVSLQTGLFVAEHLDRKKYKVEAYDTALDLPKLIKYHESIDLAFLALHGKGGEDGTIQGFLELLGVPYTGSGIRASANAIDKIAAKEIFAQNKLNVVPQIVLDRKVGYEVEQIMRKIKMPCVVKAAREGSSLGVFVPQNRLELERAIREVRKRDTHIIVEKFIQGREFKVATLGNKNKNIEALEVLETKPKDAQWLDYETRYDLGKHEKICPAEIGKTLQARLQNMAIRAHKALGCRGIACTDFIYETKTKKIYLLETDTIPPLFEQTNLMKIAKTSKIKIPKLLDKIVRLALENKKIKIQKDEPEKFIMDFNQF